MRWNKLPYAFDVQKCVYSDVVIGFRFQWGQIMKLSRNASIISIDVVYPFNSQTEQISNFLP